MLKITKEWAADHKKQQQQKRKKKKMSNATCVQILCSLNYYLNHQITIQLVSKQLYRQKKLYYIYY